MMVCVNLRIKFGSLSGKSGSLSSFQILGTMSLQKISLKMNMNYALAIGPSALDKAGGVLTGHFLLNALIPLSSSAKVKN